MAGDLVEHVALHQDPGQAVVEIDPVHAVALEPRSDVVEEVVLHPVAAGAPVASRVDGPGIAGLLADVMELVELDEVLVAPVQDGGVGRRVDQVVLARWPEPSRLTAGVYMNSQREKSWMRQYST